MKPTIHQNWWMQRFCRIEFQNLDNGQTGAFTLQTDNVSEAFDRLRTICAENGWTNIRVLHASMYSKSLLD